MIMQLSKIKLSMTLSSLPHEILFFKTLQTTLSQSLTYLSSSCRCVKPGSGCWRAGQQPVQCGEPCQSCFRSHGPWPCRTAAQASHQSHISPWPLLLHPRGQGIALASRNVLASTSNQQLNQLSCFFPCFIIFQELTLTKLAIEIWIWIESVVIKTNGWLKPKSDDSSYNARKYTAATMHFVHCNRSQPLVAY